MNKPNINTEVICKAVEQAVEKGSNPCNAYAKNAWLLHERAESLTPRGLKGVVVDVFRLIEAHEALINKLNSLIENLQADEIRQSEILIREFHQTERELKNLRSCSVAFLDGTQYIKALSREEYLRFSLAPQFYNESDYVQVAAPEES